MTDGTAGSLLAVSNHSVGKEPRYYQRIAIDRAVVQTIVQGKKRVLLTMATGTPTAHHRT